MESPTGSLDRPRVDCSSPALAPKFGFHRLSILSRRPPKPDATSNNSFGLFERHITGVETLFPVAAGAIEFGVFKRAGGERSFDASVNRIADDHLPAPAARPEVVFFLVNLAAVLDRNRADAALNRDAIAQRQFPRPIAVLLLRQIR